jgi:hypothetical protein
MSLQARAKIAAAMESAMGSAKTYRRQQSNGKERRAHTSGPKETFPTDESSVGSEEESGWEEVDYRFRPDLAIQCR